jgi:hypothetical protein
MAKPTGRGKVDVDSSGSAAGQTKASLSNFDIDGDAPKQEHLDFLVKTILPLLANGAGNIWMQGSASRTGSDAHNAALSRRRVNNVAAVLRARGIPDSQMQLEAVGEAMSLTGAAEDPNRRAVVILVQPRKKDDPPPPPTPPKPSVTVMTGDFEFDLIGWIPQSEVDNPLSVLPHFITSLLPSGMADPFFGGDNFTMPGPTPASIKPPMQTFRAAQNLSFSIGKWGDPPSASRNSTVPGLTTCLSDRRSAGGKVTFSLTATLVRAAATVEYVADDDWYEVKLSGQVLDPVPAAAAAALTAKLPGLPPVARFPLEQAIRKLATSATPSLTWKATVRIQNGFVIPKLTVADYAIHVGAEESSLLPGASSALGASTNLIHGKVAFSRWPSAVLFAAFTPTGGSLQRQPIFFSNGIGVPRPETAQILVPKLCRVRQVTW